MKTNYERIKNFDFNQMKHFIKCCFCIQWQRLKKGLIKSLDDFTYIRVQKEETKQKLRQYAINQPRYNGKFSNIYKDKELLESEK